MLSIYKSTSDRKGLGCDFSSSNIASTSANVFVPPSNNVEIENNEIKTEEKKDVQNPRAKKANFQKPKQKKQHLYYHCRVVGHT